MTGPRGTSGGSNPTGGEYTEKITGRVLQGIKEFRSKGGGGGVGMFSLTEWIMKGAVWLVLLLFVGLGCRMEQRSYGGRGMQASRKNHSRHSHDPIQVTLSLKTHLPHPWLGIFRIFSLRTRSAAKFVNLYISGTHVCEIWIYTRFNSFFDVRGFFEIMNVYGMVIDIFVGAYIGQGVVYIIGQPSSRVRHASSTLSTFPDLLPNVANTRAAPRFSVAQLSETSHCFHLHRLNRNVYIA